MRKRIRIEGYPPYSLDFDIFRIRTRIRTADVHMDSKLYS